MTETELERLRREQARLQEDRKRRSAETRKRLRAAGYMQKEVWLRPETIVHLEAIKSQNEFPSFSNAIDFICGGLRMDNVNKLTGFETRSPRKAIAGVVLRPLSPTEWAAREEQRHKALEAEQAKKCVIYVPGEDVPAAVIPEHFTPEGDLLVLISDSLAITTKLRIKHKIAALIKGRSYRRIEMDSEELKPFAAIYEHWAGSETATLQWNRACAKFAESLQSDVLNCKDEFLRYVQDIKIRTFADLQELSKKTQEALDTIAEKMECSVKIAAKNFFGGSVAASDADGLRLEILAAFYECVRTFAELIPTPRKIPAIASSKPEAPKRRR